MPRSPRRLATTVAASFLALAAVLPAGAAGPLTSGHGRPGKLTTAQISALAAQADQPSIVIFKNQHPEAPASAGSLTQRAQSLDADQAAVKSELTQLRAPRLKSYHIVNAVSATISKAEAQRLAADPSVQAVVPDVPRRIVTPDGAAAISGGASASAGGGVAAATAGPTQAICPSD